MHIKHAPARAMSLLSVALLLGAGLPLFAASTAEAGARYFEEDWEVGSSGWTYSTNQPLAQQDCTTRFAYRGVCSIEVNAQMKGQTASVSRAFTNLQFNGEPGYVVSDYFQAEFPFAKSACAHVVQFGGGVKATLNFNYGAGNQASLSTQTPNGNASTGPLLTPSGQQWTYNQATWYRPILKVDLIANKLRIEVRATNDSLLATGPALPLPAGSGSSIERIAYESYYYGDGSLTQRPAKCNFDWLQVAGPDAPTAPQLLTAIAGPGLGQTTVSWQAPSDDGGVPVLYYNVYRGDSAVSVTALIGNTTTRSFTATGMTNGETHYYAARAVNAAGEGAMSNTFLGATFNVPSAPRAVTGNGGANVGEVRLTWQAPASNGSASITNYRIYRGTSSGNETFYAQVGNVLSFTDPNLPNGTRYYYNVTAVNFVGEGQSSNETSSLPKPDGATAPAALILRPDPWWSGMTRTLNFTYSVAASQCAPAQNCPITHEWRVYQDGTTTGADGILLANGTNSHSGHAELTAYVVNTTVAPAGLDATHRLKVAVNAREGSTQWRITPLNFQIGLPQPDPVCNANPGYFTYLMPGIAPAPGAGWQYAKTYRYKLNGVPSTSAAVFVDGCPSNGSLGPGDGYYEIGYGGILLDGSTAFGNEVIVVDSTGNLPTFYLGTDRDGNGFIGDSVGECFTGPFRYSANVTCLPDAAGKVVLLFQPPAGAQPDQLPSSSDPIWGRSTVCERVRAPGCGAPICNKCGGGGGTSGGGMIFQLDKTADGLGDAWQTAVNDTAAQVDAILGPFMDQEFPAGKPCKPFSVGDCLGKGVGDGLKTIEEFRWMTNPIGSVQVCVPMGSNNCRTVLADARDYDNDNWEDGPEWLYWNDGTNDLVLNNPTWKAIFAAPQDPDANQSYDSDTLGTLHDPDSDDDGLLDGDENATNATKKWQSYPEFADSDCKLEDTKCSSPGPTVWSTHEGTPGTGDRINDKAETSFWLNISPGAITTDWDHDGISNNLLDPDADGDRILDAKEIPLDQGGLCLATCTNASRPDTDGDGLLDDRDLVLSTWNATAQEFIVLGVAHDTLPNGDTKFYGEVAALTDVLDYDSDDDGLPDGWEVKYHLDPNDDSDADSDSDEDGLNNTREYAYLKPANWPANKPYWSGLDPRNPDTDTDGISDGAEISGDAYWPYLSTRTNPFDPDTDHDGLPDGEYLAQGTNPDAMDTDKDGLSDYDEVVTYAAKHVSPLDWNTDSDNATNNNDTLSDWQEVIQLGTDPNNWDTDSDGWADGRDEHPFSKDDRPRVFPMTQGMLNPNHEAYVVFRKSGYVDTLVRDAHDGEQKISFVSAMVKVTGPVDGTSKTVTIHRDAERGDDGTFWGARFALPSHMGGSTSQTFALTVVMDDGSFVTYWNNDTADDLQMSRVGWSDEEDPFNPGEWSELKSHTSATEANAPAPGVSMSLDPMAPFSMNITDLFRVFGETRVYRLRPFSVVPNQLELLNATTEANGTLRIDYSLLNLDADLVNPGSLGIEQTLLHDADGSLVNLSEYGGRNVLNAFERVDPLANPGPYTASADDGQYNFRTQRKLYEGRLVLWKDPDCVFTHGCQTYLIDSATLAKWQAERAAERRAEQEAADAAFMELVKGISGYTDLVEFKASYNEGNVLGMGWHGVMLALTAAPLVGMATKFVKAGKGVAAADAAMASRGIADESLAIGAGDRTAATLGKNLNIMDWIERNPTAASGAYDLRYAMGPKTGPLTATDAAEFRALSDEVEGPVLWSKDIPLSVQANRITAREMAREIIHSPIFYPGVSIADATKDMGRVMKAVRKMGPVGGLEGEALVAQTTKDIYELRGVKGATEWWPPSSSTIRLNFNGQRGAVGEILQNGKGVREELYVLSETNVPVKSKLVEIPSAIEEMPRADGTRARVKYDQRFKLPDGRFVDGEVKSGVDGAAGNPENFAQMDDGAFIISEKVRANRNSQAPLYPWRTEVKPAEGLVNFAQWMQTKYGVEVQFFDWTGAPWNV